MVVTMKSMYTMLMFFCMALAALVKASTIDSKPMKQPVVFQTRVNNR
ncbi:MAG TPA: hypothetical protein VFF04_00135 [Candidatus Babeliales bacterium]|nr:hypothetical protein [Candidatus Babeliales bacterium]